MMAEDSVEEYVDSSFMGLLHEFTQVVFRPEMGVDFEVIVCEISSRLELFSPFGFRTVENRGQPDSRGPEGFDMVEGGDYAPGIPVLSFSLGAPPP